MHETYRNYELERILCAKKIKAKLCVIDSALVGQFQDYQARVVTGSMSLNSYIDDKHLEKMREGILHDNIFPAIVVEQVQDKYKIVDGRHRYHAWTEAGLNVVAYVIAQGTPEPLMRLLACILNDKHGKPNSSADAVGEKHQTIERALKAVLQKVKILPLGGTPGDIGDLIRNVAKDHELKPDLLKGRYQQVKVNHLLSMAEVELVCGSELSRCILPIFEQGQSVKDVGGAIALAKGKGLTELYIAEAIRNAQRQNLSVAWEIAMLGSNVYAKLVTKADLAIIPRDTQRIILAFTELAGVLSRKPSTYVLDDAQRKELQYYGQKIVNTVAIFLDEIGS